MDLQILGQLQELGKHFDAIEAKSCKKSTDSTKIKKKNVKSKSKAGTPVTLALGHQGSSHIPDLQSIRQDAALRSPNALKNSETMTKQAPSLNL